MKRNPKLDTKKLARALGAEHSGKVPARSGYFGAVQLVAEIRSRFQVPEGARDTAGTRPDRVRPARATRARAAIFRVLASAVRVQAPRRARCSLPQEPCRRIRD